jgi:hypothetical protein
MDIRSLVLLHGAVSAYNAPVTADRMAVWGEVSWQQMHQLGVEEKKLKIFGSPRHDDPPHFGDSSTKRRLAAALLCDAKPCFTFFSNGNDLYRNTNEAVVGCTRWLMAAADKLGSRFNFLVRLHPNEDGSIYRGCRNLRVFKNECDLGTSLAGSDIVAALCSTVLVEGVLYGKPVLQFHSEGWPDLADNWQRGLALRIKTGADLVDKLELLADEKERSRLAAEQQRLKTKLFANLGHATEVTGKYICEVCAC